MSRRNTALWITVFSIALIATAVNFMPEESYSSGRNVSFPLGNEEVESSMTSALDSPSAHIREQKIAMHFRQSVVMLHAKQYDYAITALHELLLLAPEMPEAHVNMGYALLGLERFEAARDFFDTATTLKPHQVNAYYGLALSEAGRGELMSAVGAMETYIHLSSSEDPFLENARKLIGKWRTEIDRKRPDISQDNESSSNETGVVVPS